MADHYTSGSSPLSRGIHDACITGLRCAAGSSPLSRGIRLFELTGDFRERIIPALAGNTTSRTRKAITGPDHPRSRGEYLASNSLFGGSAGSSPLSRGIPICDIRWRDSDGIIPALAGNTRRLWSPRRQVADHPRSRGEYDPQRAGYVYPGGSSPLSRGIPSATSAAAPSVRIIPALAGNTSGSTAGTPDPADHPRSRGEYAIDTKAITDALGSSPLSRGIRLFELTSDFAQRIIPALAGNTRGVA